MAELQFNTTINCPIDTVFNLIADLGNYNKWLPPSNTYSAVTKIADPPVRLGTTYTDKGTSSVMRGEVTRFEPPTHITFRQSTRFKLFVFNAGVDIQVEYTLETVDNKTHVIRNVTFEGAGLLKLLQFVVASTIRKESQRILQAMKTYLEKQL